MVEVYYYCLLNDIDSIILNWRKVKEIGNKDEKGQEHFSEISNHELIYRLLIQYKNQVQDMLVSHKKKFRSYKRNQLLLLHNQIELFFQFLQNLLVLL